MEEKKSTPVYASFWIRLGAYFIDSLLFNFIFFLSGWFLITAYAENTGLLIKSVLGFVILAILLRQIFWWLYLIFTTAYFGGTLGKRLFGLRVCGEEGKKLTFSQSAFRYIVGYTVSGVIFELGFLAILKDKKRQGWHDQVSGTYVVCEQTSGVVVGLFSLILFLIADGVLLFFILSTLNLQAASIKSFVESDVKTVKEQIQQEELRQKYLP